MNRDLSSADAILGAAVDILHRKGAGALTVRSVATLAGCSTTGVYTWFGGKNGLVEAIFVDGFRRFGLALDAARISPDPGEPRDLANAYRRWALQNPTHYMVMFGRSVPDYEPSPEALVAAMATFEMLVAATTAAINRGELAGQPRNVAHHLWATIHGYVSLELAGMDAVSATDDDRRQSLFAEGLTLVWLGCR